jgi:glycosyltransferase involved in cell wall biosynthesis
MRFHLCIPAYNEERTIRRTLRFLDKELQESALRPSVMVCCNGCTDRTAQAIRDIEEELSFPITTLCSERGMLNAQRAMLKAIDDDFPIVFMDADLLVPAQTLHNMLGALDGQVKVASAYPYLESPPSGTLLSRLKQGMLNIKRIDPQVEVAVSDVSRFHPGATSDFERQSRIYFHGTCFAVEGKRSCVFPPASSAVRGDDTFLSHYLLTHEGSGSVKVLYDAPVYCYPVFSVHSHLRVWFRIRKDLEMLYSEYPEFLPLRQHTMMRVNWRRVLQMSLEHRCYAIGYWLLKRYEGIVYWWKKDSTIIDAVWSYDVKQVAQDPEEAD